VNRRWLRIRVEIASGDVRLREKLLYLLTANGHHRGTGAHARRGSPLDWMDVQPGSREGGLGIGVRLDGVTSACGPFARRGVALGHQIRSDEKRYHDHPDDGPGAEVIENIAARIAACERETHERHRHGG